MANNKTAITKKNEIIVSPDGYAKFLQKIKDDILQSQIKAAVSVTEQLNMLYWRTGKDLSEKSKLEGWGAKVVESLAHDLEVAFPGMAGFSIRNLRYMKKFAEAYPNENTATAVAQLPWGHNLMLLEKLEGIDQRMWYAKKTLENGWSRSVLTMWIESGLYDRQGRAITNFKATLPEPHSDLAEQTLKSPYNFNFLTMDEKAREREIEQGLTDHVQKFLLELGQGFAFVGKQYHLPVGTKDFYADMLFYHLNLRCYVVIELKAEEFDAGDVGQINLYLSAVDDLLRRPGDQPSIGLLLCKTKDNYVAEYALRDINKPIGISNFTTKLVEKLPKELKSSLPSIQEIEAELSRVIKPEKKKRAVKKK